jgi:chromosome partitioning protein
VSTPSSASRGNGRPRVLAIANQKGGVGKTTTAINLSTALALTGHTVLLVDLDPQGNASTGLGVGRGQRRFGTYAALVHGASPDQIIQATAVNGLHVIPADPELAGAEIELVSLPKREYRLKDVIERLPAHQFHYVLIDCPPSLTLLTLNGLVAADSVLVPLQCEFLALEGISQLMHTIERVRRGLNPALRLHGIVLTMFDRRNNLSELVAADARSFFGAQVYQTVIPRNVRLSEAPSHGKPVALYDDRSPGAIAYAKLADEVLRREMETV